MLVQQKDFAGATEAEVGHAAPDQDPAEQNTARGPNIEAIAAAAVDVAIHVDLDAIRDSRVGKGEKPAVGQERLARVVRYVKGVAASC